jgi:DNA-binding response OmpR family regulator
MVVDDDTDIIQSIKKAFEKEGHMVQSAKTGMECLDKLEKGFEGILLIDIMMPHMDGWDTIKQIVNRGFIKNVDILVITAIGTPPEHQEKMRGLEPYIQDYISKPFSIFDLIKSVKKLS